ncbi:hypothetical protein FIU87_00970 [Bacillus sp. THAF10]|nr:hypothetical protein FIU87_00970 [Bacillus sp. THAF10]
MIYMMTRYENLDMNTLSSFEGTKKLEKQLDFPLKNRII